MWLAKLASAVGETKLPFIAMLGEGVEEEEEKRRGRRGCAPSEGGV